MSRTPRRMPTRRLATIGGVAAATAGLIASAGLVWNASYSAFSSQTTTPTNNWTAGTVALTNGQTGSALYTVTNLKPGYTDAKCITVTSSGNLPSVVSMYTTASSYANTKSLGSVITLTIQQGTGSCGSFTADGTGGTVYSGTVAGFAAADTSYANSAGSWTTTGGASETKVYKFSLGFNPSGTQAVIDAYQAGTASIGFTWEAQNT